MIRSQCSSKEYRKNWDGVFVKKPKDFDMDLNTLYNLYIKNLMLFNSDCKAQTDYDILDIVESRVMDLKVLKFQELVLDYAKLNPEVITWDKNPYFKTAFK